LAVTIRWNRDGRGKTPREKADSVSRDAFGNHPSASKGN
jgi:hypothetical protein